MPFPYAKSAWERAQLFVEREGALGKMSLYQYPGGVQVNKLSDNVIQRVGQAVTGVTFKSTCQEAEGFGNDQTCMVLDTSGVIMSIIFWLLIFACCIACCCCCCRKSRGKQVPTMQTMRVTAPPTQNVNMTQIENNYNV